MKELKMKQAQEADKKAEEPKPDVLEEDQEFVYPDECKTLDIMKDKYY